MSVIFHLYNQRATAQSDIANKKNEISRLEDKISRLQKASTELATIISQLGPIKSSIKSLAIDVGRWKGKEEKNFEEAYSEYEVSVKDYISKTEDAKEVIDNDIQRYEADKASCTTGLNNLQSSLDSLETMISQAEKG